MGRLTLKVLVSRHCFREAAVSCLLGLEQPFSPALGLRGPDFSLGAHCLLPLVNLESGALQPLQKARVR